MTGVQTCALPILNSISTWSKRASSTIAGRLNLLWSAATQTSRECSRIARELMHHKGLRVITNNLNVAAILSGNPDCEVIVAGGIVRSRDRGIVGEVTVDFIQQFKVDIGLIGISGIEVDGTLRDFDYREVKVARAILEHSREVWVAADHSKFNRPAMVELARFDQVDMLFTDAPPPAPFPALLAEAGVNCVTCAEDA